LLLYPLLFMVWVSGIANATTALGDTTYRVTCIWY
jgi:hypothetical protein